MGKKNQLNLVFLSASDPLDRKSWSGIYSFMLNELINNFEHVEVIGPIASPYFLRIWLSGIAGLHRIVFNKKYDKLRSKTLSTYYSCIISNRLKTLNIDVIFAPAGSTEIAFLDTSIPICYYSDSSFAQISSYYEDYKGISEWSKRESNQIEKKAIERASACVYSSAWAADFVCDYYHKPKNEVFIVKFGANIIPTKRIEPRDKSQAAEFNILFLGVDWKRKGGAKVLAVFNSLREKGYTVSLTICGCNPDIADENITVIPFIDKNKAEGQQLLESILIQTHIMLLPTEADCTPIVLNEAAAFGIPVIVTDTGGISSQVEHGVTGFLTGNTEDFLHYSELLINDTTLYQQMSENALRKYQNELNWTKWGEEIKTIIQNLASQSS